LVFRPRNGRHDIGAHHRLGGARSRAHHRRAGIAVADPEQRIGMAHLVDHRRAQRTGGNDGAVADTAARIERDQGIVVIHRPALETVIHDDEVDAIIGELPGAGRAVARHHGRRGARQQKRLVADGERGVMFEIDAMRAEDAAAVAARQEARPVAGFRDGLADGDRGRRLAGAADGQIADAQHRRHHLGGRAVSMRKRATAP
jgi:hypothetical protein